MGFLSGIVGSLVGPILGGVFDKQSTDSSNKSNLAAVRATNAANERMAAAANKMAQDLAGQNIAYQKEFAQSGIQWRVDDAKRAGLHPLAAIGASGSSFSPVSANFTASRNEAPRYQKNNVGSILANLQIQNSQAQNESLRAQARYYDARALESLNKGKAAEPSTPRPAAMITDLDKPKKLYRKWIDNRTGKEVYLPDPESGIQMPETIGAGYWLDAKGYQSDKNWRYQPKSGYRRTRRGTRRQYQ